MRQSSTVRLMVRQAHHAAHDEACVDDFRDHVGFVLRLSPKGGRLARSGLTGAISIASYTIPQTPFA